MGRVPKWEHGCWWLTLTGLFALIRPGQRLLAVQELGCLQNRPYRQACAAMRQIGSPVLQMYKARPPVGWKTHQSCLPFLHAWRKKENPSDQHNIKGTEVQAAPCITAPVKVARQALMLLMVSGCHHHKA